MLKSPSLTNFFSTYRNYFHPFANKKILITGGTGFFGKCLAMAFDYANTEWKLNVQVVSLSRKPQNFLQLWPEFSTMQNIEFRTGDVGNFTSSENDFDFIIHAATEASAKLEQENPAEMAATIIDGTKNILAFAQQQQNTQMLFISSGGVYGKLTAPVDEEKNCEPFTVYGKSKLAAESMCITQNKVPVTIARCFAFAGAYLPLDSHFAIGNFVRNAVLGQDIIIKSDGSPVRSYMYAGDLVLWLLSILTHGQHARIYNVGADEAVTIKQLAEKIAQHAQKKISVQVLGATIAGAADYYVPNIERAKTELGLAINTDLEQTIHNYFVWAQSLQSK